MCIRDRLTIAEIAEVTNIGEIRAKAVAEKLVEAGLVDASGNNKARFYILSSKVYKAVSYTHLGKGLYLSEDGKPPRTDCRCNRYR